MLRAAALLGSFCSAHSRSCVRVHYAPPSGHMGGGVCAGRYEEVCSGWMEYGESCEDIMPSVTAERGWETGGCVRLMGSALEGRGATCPEASNLPGRLFAALKLASLLGWPLRADHLEDLSATNGQLDPLLTALEAHQSGELVRGILLTTGDSQLEQVSEHVPHLVIEGEDERTERCTQDGRLVRDGLGEHRHKCVQ